MQLNPVMYEFVCKHKVAIEKLNYYEWARFLEKVNEDTAVDHLLSKIDESTLRTRNSLAYYRDILFQEFENKCIYCGEPVLILCSCRRDPAGCRLRKRKRQQSFSQCRI